MVSSMMIAVSCIRAATGLLKRVASARGEAAQPRQPHALVCAGVITLGLDKPFTDVAVRRTEAGMLCSRGKAESPAASPGQGRVPRNHSWAGRRTHPTAAETWRSVQRRPAAAVPDDYGRRCDATVRICNGQNPSWNEGNRSTGWARSENRVQDSNDCTATLAQPGVATQHRASKVPHRGSTTRVIPPAPHPTHLPEQRRLESGQRLILQRIADRHRHLHRRILLVLYPGSGVGPLAQSSQFPVQWRRAPIRRLNISALTSMPPQTPCFHGVKPDRGGVHFCRLH